MIDAFYEAYKSAASGGLFMIPLVAIGVLMVASAVNEQISLIKNRRALFNSQTQKTQSAWMRLARFYRENASGIASVDADLRERLAASAVSSVVGLGSGFLLLCASLSTVLGLLGTVSGMMASFDAMSVVGVADVRHMADGISEALITTQSGLMTAVVGVVLGKWLSIREALLVREAGDFLKNQDFR